MTQKDGQKIGRNFFEKIVEKLELDLTERIQIVTFWRLETFKNIIFWESQSQNIWPKKMVKNIRSQFFEKMVEKLELDLTDRIQIVTFWRLETLKNLIFEPLKVGFLLFAAWCWKRPQHKNPN